MIYADLEEWRADNPIKRLRSRLNLSQVEFSQTLHIGTTVVYSWEKGRSMPNGENCQKLSDMGLVIQDLIDWKKNKPLE